MTIKKCLLGALACLALSAQATPVFNIFELGIRPNQQNAYDEVGRHNINTSIAQGQGTLAMYSARHRNQPDTGYMFEIYADESAYRTHLQSAQYKAFLSRSPEILTEHKRKIELDAQFLGDKLVTQTDQTINNLVIVDVKPEHAQAFKNIVVPEMTQSLNAETGVLAMYAATEKTNPNRWYFYEIYADDAAKP